MTIQCLGNIGYQGGITYSPLKFVTEAEYWEKYYDYPDVTYEWNNGYLEEKAVSDFATYLTYEWFWELLKHYLRTKPIAKTVGLETGFKLKLPHKTFVRRPDSGIVLNTNKIPLLPKDRSYKGTFDLCIEAVSDSTKADIERDTEDKFEEYAQAGVKEYYILDGHDRYSGFYRLGTSGIYQPIQVSKGIIKSIVLPGFQFRIEDLYNCPSFFEMTEDKVYKDFVLPEYAEALQRAEEAEQRVHIAFSEGAQKKTFEIASNLLGKGFAPALIAEMTGLSNEELTKLLQ